MPLTDQEKSGLAAQLAALVEANEPEAMLATLQRVAEKKAIDALITEREADRWHALADSCKRVASELEAVQAPKRAQEADQTLATGA